MLRLVVGRTSSILDYVSKLTLSTYKNNLNSTRYLWFETINHVYSIIIWIIYIMNKIWTLNHNML